MDSFSAEELQQLRDAFNVFDRDASGAIDATEFALAAAEFGVQISSAEVQDIFVRYDEDNSGSIEFSEFAMVMADKLHPGASESDTDDDANADSDEEGNAASGAHANAGPRQFDKLPREDLVVKGAWLKKLEADIVEALRAAAEGGHAEDDGELGDDGGGGGPMRSVARRLGTVYSMLRTHRKVLPFTDLPPNVSRYAPAPASEATDNDGAEEPTAEETAQDAETMMEYLRDCAIAIDERIESLDAQETVVMRGLHPEPERLDPLRAKVIPPRFVDREVKKGGTSRAQLRGGSAVHDALQSLAGFQFDNAAAAADCATSTAVSVPIAHHAREHVRGLDDVPTLSGAEAFRWYVQSKLRYGLCVVDPVCAQINRADDPQAAGVLDVSGMGLNDEAAEALAFVLQRDGFRADSAETRRYTSLIANRNRISPAGATALLDASAELQLLDLGRNGLGNRSAVLLNGGAGPSLHRLLQRSGTLTHLDLSSNGLSDRDGHSLCEALKTNVVLCTLILRNNNFGRATGFDLASAISYNRELKHLDVSYNRFDAVGTHALLEELGETSTFEYLDVSWTGVTDESAEHVARLIAGGSNLRCLKLAHNSLGERGGTAIAKALPGTRSLVQLDLGHNPLGDAGLAAVLREAANNTSIEYLEVQHVRAGEHMSGEVAQAMAARAERVSNQNFRFLA